MRALPSRANRRQQVPAGSRPPKRLVSSAVALAAGTAAVALAGCGVPVIDSQQLASRSKQSTAADASSTPSKPAAEHAAGKNSQLGADEFYKITMTVTNHTNQDLWISSATLGREGSSAGWDDRATNLVAGASETVSAYAATGGQGIRLVYKSPKGSMKVTLVAQNPTIGKNNYDGTKATTPIQVASKITDGLHSTATYDITGSF